MCHVTQIMSLVSALRRPPIQRICCVSRRFYATKDTKSSSSSKPDASGSPTSPPAGEGKCHIQVFHGASERTSVLLTFQLLPVSKSSCIENTVLQGLAYLKGQPPVIARADDDYPSWLWTLLQPKVFADDGPGSKAEKYKLRKDNRQRIRDQNFMKTQ